MGDVDLEPSDTEAALRILNRELQGESLFRVALAEELKLPREAVVQLQRQADDNEVL